MKKFRTFGKKVSAGLSKLHSTCPKEHFEGNYFLSNFSFSIFFQTLSKKIGLLARYFWQGYWNNFLGVKKIILHFEEVFLIFFSIIFGLWVKFFSDLFQFGGRKTSRSKTWTNFVFSVNAIGRRWVKNLPFEWKILLSYCKQYGAK